MIFKNITLNKRFEVKAPTHPTHDLVASDDKYENKTVVGSMWTRVAQDKNGTDYKFLSGTLSKNRTGTDGKVYKGYVLISEDEYNELTKNALPIVKVDLGEVSNKELEDIF